MNEQQTIEQRVASAILQQPREIELGGTTYHVAPPTIATIILVSEAISTIPTERLDDEHIVEETLRIAKDCRVIGDILATMILGAKGLTEEVEVEERRLFGLIRRTKKKVVDRKAELSKRLLEELSPSQLNRAIPMLFKGFELGDFFGTTTFLIGVNVLQPTKGRVENETTAPGL